MPLSSINDAIEDIRSGKIIIIVDDEDRENEGDLAMAAELITPDAVNFMATEGRGLICTPMMSQRLDHLRIPMMVYENTARLSTAFTVSVDVLDGATTGISAHDRAATIKALIDPKTQAGRPCAARPYIPPSLHGRRCAEASGADGGGRRFGAARGLAACGSYLRDNGG